VPGDLFEADQGLLQLLRHRQRAFDLGRGTDGTPDLVAEVDDRRPAVLAELAGEEVHRLDAVRPFVDRT
jgi:hypothetical protein